MKKKQTLLPRAKSLASRLQEERETLQNELKDTKRFLGDQDRAAMGIRLIEVKRALNRLYAAGE